MGDDIAAMIAAKARAAAQKVSELNGLPTRHRAHELLMGQPGVGAPSSHPLLLEGAGGSGPATGAPTSGALVAVDGASGHHHHQSSGVGSIPVGDATQAMSTGSISQRVNGALVVVRPDQREALTFAQYRQQHFDQQKKPKRSGTRWGDVLGESAAALRGRTLCYKTRIDQLTMKMESPHPIELPPVSERSPSPPPAYDPVSGLRSNTREQRIWDTWDAERREVVHETLRCDPLYKPPHGHRPLVKELRLYIPHKENPGYNFIGLIIGPRGNTQKRLQQETGARIAIRGRGSEKEGQKVKFSEGQDDDLHVHISADTIEKVDKAARLIYPLLTPLDEEHNVHKQRQLRELAEINGTFKDVSKLQEMLIQEEQNATMYKLSDELQVKVDKMYERDVAAKLAAESAGAGAEPAMDDEYENFLSELTGNLGDASVPGHDRAGSGGGAGVSGAGADGPGGAAGVGGAAGHERRDPSSAGSRKGWARAEPAMPAPATGPGWAPGSMPEHLRASMLPPPGPPPTAGAAASAPPPAPAAPAKPVEVCIPSTKAIDAVLALGGLYGAGIAAAASIANTVQLMRRGGGGGGGTGTRERQEAAGQKRSREEEAAAAPEPTPPATEPEVGDEEMEDDYAKMMAELEG